MLAKLCEMLRNRLFTQKSFPVDIMIRTSVTVPGTLVPIDLKEHPDDNLLADYLFQVTSERDARHIQEHLQHCNMCNVVFDNQARKILNRIFSDMSDRDE